MSEDYIQELFDILDEWIEADKIGDIDDFSIFINYFIMAREQYSHNQQDLFELQNDNRTLKNFIIELAQKEDR